MRKDKQKAIDLRNEGKSYRQIIAELKIPKSTLSGWLGNLDWSTRIKQQLASSSQPSSTVRIRELNRIRGGNLKQAYAEAEKEAEKEFVELRYNPTFIAGMMLYWGEGDRRTASITSLSNSDPELVRFYVFFLRNVCKIPIERIRAHILLYPDLEEKVCRAYWSKRVELPWENFTKTTRISRRHPKRRLTWGVCTVNVSSTYFKRKMLVWLKLLPEELMNRAYYENIHSVQGEKLDAAMV